MTALRGGTYFSTAVTYSGKRQHENKENKYVILSISIIFF